MIIGTYTKSYHPSFCHSRRSPRSLSSNDLNYIPVRSLLPCAGQYERAVLVWEEGSSLYLLADSWARTNLPVLHEKVKPKLDHLAATLQVYSTLLQQKNSVSDQYLFTVIRIQFKIRMRTQIQRTIEYRFGSRFF